MTKRKKTLAAIGGLSGALFLTLNGTAPSTPELLLGLLAGLGIALTVVSMLPDQTLAKIRRWKGRG